MVIAGFGVEGRAAYEYFSHQPDARITIADERPVVDAPPGVDVLTGKDVFSKLDDFDIVVRSPSIRPGRIHTRGLVTSATNEFFKACPSKHIIGITGSKGKGTTATLIAKILQAAGKRVHLAGNIGVPMLDVLPKIQPDDIVVLELSSFQLWDLQRGPHIAVVLMIEPDHLDVHRDMAEYVAAKAQIVATQSADDIAIYLPGNTFVGDVLRRMTPRPPGQIIPYTEPPGAYINEEWLTMDDQAVIKVADIALLGRHNQDNACAAVTAAWQYTHDTAAMARVLREFGGLTHRLQFVVEVRGVRYYDDSISTTPGSAIAALKAFHAPRVIILGGVDKGADFTALAETIARLELRYVIVVGAVRETIAAALKRAGVPDSLVHVFDGTPSMTTIVADAAAHAHPGDLVLLSPAAASFDMFKNYEDRGRQFVAAVQALE